MGIFSRRDKDGYDKDGYDRNGYDKDGYDRNGYDKDGYDRNGFNKYNTYNKHTQTLFGKDGYNMDGYDVDGYDVDGYDKNGYDKDGHDENGYDVDGHDKNGCGMDGYDMDGYDKNGYDRSGYALDGFDKDGHDENGFNANEIHKITKTKFDEFGFNKYEFNLEGTHRLTKTKFDDAGFDRDGHDENGHDRRGLEQFNITSKFSKIISSFNSDFDAFVTLEYNEPTKIQTKSFFSHGEKTGIYSKSFESFSNNNIVHFHIEKAEKQHGTIWNKPKKTDFDQGDNFESGYTLVVNFNKNDSELKSIVIKKLGKMNFGCLVSEYTLDGHLNEEYPNDERAKELLQKVVGIFTAILNEPEQSFSKFKELEEEEVRTDDVCFSSGLHAVTDGWYECPVCKSTIKATPIGSKTVGIQCNCNDNVERYFINSGTVHDTVSEYISRFQEDVKNS
jgi:hypothetical protein